MQQRAQQVRRYAARAREQAGRDIAHGDDEGASLHRREAEAHERAAKMIEQAAALYQRRINHLSRSANRAD